LDNYAWELGTPEPAELDEDGNPILTEPLPAYEDDDARPTGAAAGADAAKASFLSRFKGMFRKAPDHQAAMLAASAAAKAKGPPHDLSDPVRVKSKEELDKDARRKKKRKKERAKLRKLDPTFAQDVERAPTPETTQAEREPMGAVGQRPPEGFPCDMRHGWRELRVYVSAHMPEMRATVEALLGLLLHGLRATADPLRIKVVPVVMAGAGAAGGEVALVGRLREMQRCHAVLLLQGSECGPPIDLWAHLEGSVGDGAAGEEAGGEGDAGEGRGGVGRVGRVGGGAGGEGRGWRRRTRSQKEQEQTYEGVAEEEQGERLEQERRRRVQAEYESEAGLCWLPHYSNSRAWYSSTLNPQPSTFDPQP